MCYCWFFFSAVYVFCQCGWYGLTTSSDKADPPHAQTNVVVTERELILQDVMSVGSKITPFETKMTTFSLCNPPPLCNCIYLLCFFTRMRWQVISDRLILMSCRFFSRKPEKYQFIYTFTMLFSVFHLNQKWCIISSKNKRAKKNAIILSTLNGLVSALNLKWPLRARVILYTSRLSTPARAYILYIYILTCSLRNRHWSISM